MHDTPEAKALFWEAVERIPPERWPEFLDSACGGNAELRQRVSKLLAAHAADGDFMAAPAGAILQNPPAVTEAAEGPGQTVGRYTLLEPIGEGGMGVVYLAEQQEPLRRKVAVKIVKPGMDTRQVVARFEAERQALAMMDHPSIARVLDGGATASGRPYFVMELIVDGVPLIEYCDANQLDVAARLELFLQVCRAVEHAHQKGVIHRDLKPAHVLVTLCDGVPVPKIIDFGIAKGLHGNLTENALITTLGQVIGTPLYMSPEQARVGGLDVDTRSDVYSLGVILYELLVGCTPFDQQRMREAGYDELHRIIREEEPPRPSARVASLGEAAATIAQDRRTDPARLARLLRRDLDWIVMKALEKDRAKRYPTATDFAQDLKRYLSDEPVEARPPTLADRAARWTRRHLPLVVAAGIALSIVMVVSTASALFVLGAYQREKEQRAIADHNAVSAEANAALATRNADLATRNATQAQKNYETARHVVKQMLARVGDEEVGAIPELRESRAALLEDAAAFYSELLKRSPRDSVAYSERGNVYELLGRHGEALADREKAVEIDANSAALQWDLAWFLYHCADPSFRDYRRALKHTRRAVELDPKNARYHLLLVFILRILKNDSKEAGEELRKAEQLASASGDLCDGLSDGNRLLGNFDKALSYAAKAAALDADNPWAHFRLAWIWLELGDVNKARAEINRAIQRNPKPNDIRAFALYTLRGQIHGEYGDKAAALADLNRAAELAPFRPEIFRYRALTHIHLGAYDKALADIARALELDSRFSSSLAWIPPWMMATCPDEQFRKRVLELSGKARQAGRGKAEPKPIAVQKSRADLGKPRQPGPKSGTLWLESGGLQLQQARWAEQIREYTREIARGEPYGALYYNRALAYLRLHDRDSALPDLDNAIRLGVRVVNAYYHRAGVHSSRGEWDKAIADYDEAIRLEAKDGDSYSERGYCYYAKGDLPRALADLSKAVEIAPNEGRYWRERAELQLTAGRRDEYRRDCGRMLMHFEKSQDAASLGWTVWTCVFTPDAVTDWSKVVALAERAAKSDPQSSGNSRAFGAALYRAGRWQEAIERLIGADRLVPEPMGHWLYTSPALARYFLAMAHQRLGHREEAKRWFDEAATMHDRSYSPRWTADGRYPSETPGALNTLRAEAAQLLGIPNVPPAAQKKEGKPK